LLKPWFSNLLKVETVSRDPALPTRQRAISLLKTANDNGASRRIRAKVLISKHLPITQAEIEVFALLLDDLASLVANDNEEHPE
jgi:hypothetical protein